ncbi:MAG: hypothetical protein RJA99_3883 [Pseudomonadota bacterium]|jgi:CDP-4-dehydro-6-deoxyglucose reductase
MAAAEEGALVLVDGSSIAFRCAAGEAILDAALAAGVALPHQCRGASCGTCKVELLEGEVDHGWALGFAITDEEKAAGRCLACQAMPRSPRLRIRPLAPMPDEDGGVREIAATVLVARAETPRVRRLVLAPVPGTALDARPGQSVELVLPGVEPNRCYSVVHDPREDGLVELWVARHPGGAASGQVHDRLRAGDTVGLRGPFGSFGVPAGAGEVVALAGGTGLAPILSVLATELQAGLADDVLLLLSVREHDEILGLERLERLARRHPNLRYEVACTDGPSPLARHRDLLPAVLPNCVPTLRGARVMVAGSPGFVAACVEAARALGARPEAIAVDTFTPAAG